MSGLVSRVRNEISRDLVSSYLASVPASPIEASLLRGRLDEYWQHVEGRSAREEFLDLRMAQRTYAHCTALLDHLTQVPEAWQAVAAAVQYFIDEDDAIADTTVIGFDDDYEIARVTCDVLGVEVETD